MKGLDALTKLRFEPTQDAEAFEIVNKSLEALEIIKNKMVKVYDFMYDCRHHKDVALKYYNDFDCPYQTMFLTEEEFNLLKEVLVDGKSN